MTDTADYADIVPATTQSRTWLMFPGDTYVTLNVPAIAPLEEAVPNTELFRRLAARMGFRERMLPTQRRTVDDGSTQWSAHAGNRHGFAQATGYAKLRIDPVPHAEGNFPPHQASVNFCLL